MFHVEHGGGVFFWIRECSGRLGLRGGGMVLAWIIDKCHQLGGEVIMFHVEQVTRNLR